jgi:hypothetical protein
MMTCHVVTKEEQPSPRYMRQEFRAVKWSTQPANSYNPVVLRGAIEPCRHGPVTNRPSRLFKKAVQQGRSERRGDAYFIPYVEPLSDARTTLADFFNSLLRTLRPG